MAIPLLGDLVAAVSKPLENIGGVSRINAENQGDIVQQALILKQKEQTTQMWMIGIAAFILLLIIGFVVYRVIKNKRA